MTVFYDIFFLNIILFIFVIIDASILTKKGVFNDDNIKDLFENWESNPIYGIDLLNNSKKQFQLENLKESRTKLKSIHFIFGRVKYLILFITII